MSKFGFQSKAHLKTMADNESLDSLNAIKTKRLNPKTMQDKLLYKKGEQSRWKAGSEGKN